MPIYNETFESYRIEVRKIQNAMGLLIERGYKIIDLENNIIEELLSGLISTTLIDLEIKNFGLSIKKNLNG